MTTKFDYNLFAGDAFGRNDKATALFNNKLVPYLKKAGIKTSQINEVYKIVADIVAEARITAAEETRFDMEEC